MLTDAEYAHRWQATAHRILGEVLAEAERAGLPPLMWTLATTGALTGEAPGLGATTAEQRAAVAAWARHLGATVHENSHGDGRVSLVAPWDREGERRGVIRAELYPADGDRP